MAKKMKFLPLAMALCPLVVIAVFLSGCSPVKINRDDEFFKVGHTYRASEEMILLFFTSQLKRQRTDYYDMEGCLLSIPDELRPRIAELRNKRELKYEGGSNAYNGLIIYVPAGTKFKVEKLYYLFPNCLEGQTPLMDITMFGEFEKYRSVVSISEYVKDITTDVDAKQRK